MNVRRGLTRSYASWIHTMVGRGTGGQWPYGHFYGVGGLFVVLIITAERASAIWVDPAALWLGDGDGNGGGGGNGGCEGQ